jgi:hypothetical protein
MNGSPVSDFHDDVLRELFIEDPEEVCWVALKDQVVACDVRLRCLAERSFDPLVLDIREALSKSGRRGFRVDELAAELRCPERIARRVLSEVLHVLCRAGEVVRAEEERFRAAQTREVAIAPREQVFERSLRYVPRSCQIGPDIPGSDTPRLRGRADEDSLVFWEQSDEERLYGQSSLAAAIRRACHEVNYDLLPDIENNDVRDEALQRSQLVSTGFRMVGCSVINPSPLPYWIIHRCYLFRSHLPGHEGWNIRVYRYPRGGEQHGYTEYFRRRRAEDESIVDSLRDASQLV